jgi:hypothetical protein
VPCAPPHVSFTKAPLGEDALPYTPDPNGAGEKLYLYCAHLEAVDAPLAVAIRTTIEHYGAEIPVVLEPPADPQICAQVLALLGERLPPALEVRGQAEPSGAGGVVLLAATPVPGFVEADELTERLAAELPEAIGTRYAGYLAGAVATLLENAIEYAFGPSVDPIVAISRDPESDLLSLAVCDTGTEIESDIEADQRLAEALERSEEREGGLAELATQAELLGIGARICLASGSGRLRWVDGSWSVGEEAYVAGTTVILEVAR